jgi:hypothetical protein
MVEWYCLGKTDVLETCPTATLSTTNPMWIDPGSNPDLQGPRMARDCLGHTIPAIIKRHILKLALCFESSRFGTWWKELQNILWTLVSSGMWRYVTAIWPWRWRHCSPSKHHTPQVTPLCEPQTVVQLRTNSLLLSTGWNTRQLTYEWVSLQLAHGNGQSEWWYSEQWRTP